MKKLYIIGCLLVLTSVFWACSEDEKGAQPSSIAGLKAEAMEGAVCLRWDIPADSNYLYVQVRYVHPKDGNEVVMNRSVYADSLLIDGLLAKDGEYRFTLHTVSNDGIEGAEKLEITCRALPVQPVTTKYTEKVEFDIEDLSTNAQEVNEGPVANLIDGDFSNFFHSSWSVTMPFPQWIEFELPEALDRFEFKTWNRDKGDGFPEWVIIQGSDDGVNWDDLLELNGEIPTTGKAKYESPVVVTDKSYTKLRYTVKSSYGGLAYFHLAEFELYKVWFKIYDPENE